MKRLAVGILAHVDAGKTTLSEALLYTSGSIRKLGRVDKKDAFLDTDKQERERGITIFSKQALLTTGDTEITLLDTPGHVDFSPEMERTLQVLDYAVLVISGSDGVQGHTMTLWKLLQSYKTPVIIFVNKMDQQGTDKEKLMRQLREQLSEGCVDFSEQQTEHFFENVAMCDEKILNVYLENGKIEQDDCNRLIGERKLFPCFFGSALKLDGVDMLLKAMDQYTCICPYPKEFGARVFKITRDNLGNRLTHMKITGGSLRARDVLHGIVRKLGVTEGEEVWEEKVNQIRIYSGEKFEAANEAFPGCICTVTGLSKTWAGEGLGIEQEIHCPILEPVLSYAILLPDGYDAAQMLPKLRQLEEEEPQLHIIWDEENQELKAQIMGQVQMEILRNMIFERFAVDVEFGPGTILYKETILGKAFGAGHFEPLRHYAEVYLLLEAGEQGSGLQFSSDCSEDVLDKNWQRLILTHLEEKEHRGVLTGSPITDIRITLKNGRAHNKHTEGGDFRQATYRAVRQGLMEAESVLLEPYYEFRLEVPDTCVGRAMTDMEKMYGSFELTQSSNGTAVLTGMAPMACIQDYSQEVLAYTRGHGRLSCNLKGYFYCHNAAEVIEQSGYDPEVDLANTPDSVFCAHGAGFVVPWYEVAEHMHTSVDISELQEQDDQRCGGGNFDITDYVAIGGTATRRLERNDRKNAEGPQAIGQDEIAQIINRTAYANRKEDKSLARAGWQRERRKVESPIQSRTTVYNPMVRKEEYLLVDGYNVIFAWKELSELAKINLDSARGKLLDILCNYQAIKKCNLIAVFDAYRVVGHPTETVDYHNIHVVYTAEAETADRYIEKFAHENSKKYEVTVATSDGLEQIIIIGEGCRLISSRELEKEIQQTSRQNIEDFQSTNTKGKISLEELLPEKTIQEIKQGTLPTIPEGINNSKQC